MAALDLKVQGWAPFKDAAYAALWQDNRASVFAWDQSSVFESMTGCGIDPRRCQVVPEIFLRQPMENGIRLVELGDGVEAQVWQDGFITTTRWWNEIPSSKEWTLFKRSIAFETDSNLSAPLRTSTPSWLDQPWNTAVAKNDVLGQMLLNKALVIPLLCLLLLPHLFFFGQWAGYSVISGNLQAEIERAESDGQAVRAERSRAITALEEVESLSSFRQFPRQIEIISRAHSLLSPFLVQVSGWDYDQGVLEFGLKSDSDMDATQYIPLFENDLMFYRVSASTRGDRLVLRMNVQRHEEL